MSGDAGTADPHELFRRVRRTEYPDLDRGIYLNAASFGPPPRRTLEAVHAFNRRKHEAFSLDEKGIGRALWRARQGAARLVGAEVDEITLAPNTGFGVNLAGALAKAGPPGAIILPDGEFPANVYPWMALEGDGFTVERIAGDDRGRPDTGALASRLEEGDVRVLAISAVQFANGYRAELGMLGEICRAHGALLAVDAIQAAGAVPLDVRETGIDVLACGGQKWLCAPFGSGFVYVTSRLRDRIDPPLVSWLAFGSSRDFHRLVEYDTDYLPDGRRFEPATLGAQDYLGLAESVELLLELGIERIRDHLLALHRPLLEWIDARGDAAELLTPRDPDLRAGIVSLRVRDLDGASRALRREGVVFAEREGAIRLAPHFYNTGEEMEAVVEILDRAV